MSKLFRCDIEFSYNHEEGLSEEEMEALGKEFEEENRKLGLCGDTGWDVQTDFQKSMWIALRWIRRNPEEALKKGGYLDIDCRWLPEEEQLKNQEAAAKQP